MEMDGNIMEVENKTGWLPSSFESDVLVLRVSRKRYLPLFIIFLIMLTNFTQSYVTYNQLELQLKGETHKLSYNLSGFYIDYYGDKYRIEATENAEFIDVTILSLIHISEPTRRTPISYAV